MDISVILERVNENGYRATALMPLPVVTEASTREQALEQISTLLCEKLSGAELVHVDVPGTTSANPWMAIAGTWRDNAELDEVGRNIDAYRRQVNADPSRL